MADIYLRLASSPKSHGNKGTICFEKSPLIGMLKPAIVENNSNKNGSGINNEDREMACVEGITKF